jgi:S1-C subfamily serine protease
MRTALSAIIIAAIAAASPVLAKQAVSHKPAAAPVARSGQVTPPRTQNKAAAKSENEKEVAILAALDRGSAATPASFPDSVGWRLVEDPATGAWLGMPEKLVPRVSASRMGGRWSSAQGQIQVETFRFSEASLPALFEDEKKAARRQIEASVLRPDLFVIAGAQGLKSFFMRAEARGGEVRGVTVLYDQATEGTMERIALAMIGSYSAFPDPSAPAPPGLRRAVEYGSAIVATGDGDLVTSARLTDDCRSITVPGIGHAERIAADSASDLALVRVYGARNLVPAALSGESGGAVVDARGALAGTIDFKPAIVAANGDSAHEPAKRVPVEAIRAFLKAHDVSPPTVADATASAEQSMVRIICVRK